MKIKLPSLPKFRREAEPPPSLSSSGMRIASGGAVAPSPGPGPAITIGGFGERIRLVNRRLRGAAGYVFLFIFVFFVFIWVSLPTRAIAWRAGQMARDAGYIVDIEDLSISPFGGVTLYNVRWTFQPSHAGQVPRSLDLPEVDIEVGVLGLLLGSYDVTVDTMIDEATIHAEYARDDDESTIKISVTALPLYDVPKLQQSLNAPLAGLFGLEVDLTLPENKFAKAEGIISLSCAACTIGDNETPLFMPGSSGLMAKGVTLPTIDLGSLGGKLIVSNGKATTDKFETDSDDLTVKITGGMTLADPFNKSEVELDLKLLVKPNLQDRSEPLKLMVQTAGVSTKLDGADEGWLGFKLRGSPGKPKFSGLRAKSREERQREARQKALEREAKRKSKKAKADKAKEGRDDDKPGSAAEADTPDSAVRDSGADEVKPEAAREDERPEDRPEAKRDEKPEEAREEPKEEVKEEPKEEAKEEPKEEPREEPKPEEKPPEEAQPPAEGGENPVPEAPKEGEGGGGGGEGGEPAQ